MRLATLGLAALVGLTASCSWTRFDDQQDNSPVILLKKPDKMGQGFGVSLATASNIEDKSVRLLVGGTATSSGAASYSLGTADQPNIDAVDTGHCDRQGNPCFLGQQLLGTRQLRATDNELRPLCFVIGLGSTANSGSGLLVRCEDDTEFTLAVPAEVDTEVITPAFEDDMSDNVLIQGDRALLPSIVAAVPRVQLAWYYGPDSKTPHLLIPGGQAAEGTYGASVAVAQIGADLRVIGVGAPNADRVFLFRSDDPAVPPTLLGCIGGTPQFGRTMAAGTVTPGDTDEDLVIADSQNVYVFEADKLASIQPTGDVSQCSLAGLPEGALFASFGCGSDEDTAGCSGSLFGEALAVGDIDGDGDGEVLVGAPRMKARGESNAGAVLVYDVEDPRRELIQDVLFISSAEADDLLGSTIIAPNLGERAIVAAGAPGNGKTALFYCNSKLSSDKAGKRCL